MEGQNTLSKNKSAKPELRFIVCAVLFAVLCVAVFQFLHLFTQEKDSVYYLEWDSSEKILADGSSEPIDANDMALSSSTSLTGAYRFTAQLPEGLSQGALIFETSGAAITLYLNDTEIYNSSVLSSASFTFSQASVELAEGSSGQITLLFEILDGENIIFPPFLRFVPDLYEMALSTAAANMTAFPSGAAALALVLTAGIFLLGLAASQPDYTLIPLLLAQAGLTSFPLFISQSGYFFSSSFILNISTPVVYSLLILFLALYLAVNHRRGFLKLFAYATVFSLLALSAAWLVSYLRGGYLASFMSDCISVLLAAGYSDNLLYWFTWWLTIVCFFLCTYGVLTSYNRQLLANQEISLTNRLLEENYHSLQQHYAKINSLRHESVHNLTVLSVLAGQGDCPGLSREISRLLDSYGKRRLFSENTILNAIVSHAAEQAEKLGIPFEASVMAEGEINIPSRDLCGLILNMTDNALDACKELEPTAERKIRLQISQKHSYLTIKCENTYDGRLLKKKKDGTFESTKDGNPHGLGMSLMARVAGKYNGILDIPCTDDGWFVVQTVLNIPDMP